MNKGDYVTELFNDIKDLVESDSDVLALKSLLIFMLEEDVNYSYNNWKYVIMKYDIKNMMLDIDFKPLIIDYSFALLKKVGIEQFFIYMNELSKDKVKYIYRYLFNIYENECFIYQSLDYYLKKNDNKDEEIFIQTILNKCSDFFEDIFDKTDFVKKVILFHIDHNRISKSLFQKLISSIDNKKEQAVLKTLLIDYVII